MSSPALQTNCAPTAVETTRIRKFIQSRRKDIDYLSIRIEEEEACINTSQKAISNLEGAIPRGKEALKIHEENLAALIAIQERYSTFQDLPALEMKLEPHSQGLHDEMKSASEGPISRSSASITYEVNTLKEEVRKLWDKFRDLEIELQGWKSSLDLSQAALLRLINSKKEMEASLNVAVAAFRPTLKISTDLWSKIFKIAAFQELEEYLKYNADVPLRSIALVLSHVSRSWRQIVANEAELYNNIAMHANQYWSANKYELWMHCVSKVQSPITFVFNLSQALTWTYMYAYDTTYGSSYQYRNQLGVVIQLANPDWDTMLAQKSYMLHINVSDDQNHIMQKMTFIPLATPLALTLSSRSSVRYGYIFSQLSRFSAIKSLTLINDHPQHIPSLDVTSLLPQLTALTLTVKAFPANFQLTSFLARTLEELYIRDDGGNLQLGLSNEVELPGLRILGLTGPGSSFLQWVRMPALLTIVFYGPNVLSNAAMVTGDIAESTYGRMHHVEFEDWAMPKEEEGDVGAVAFFRDIAIKMPSLRSGKFVRSWVDGGNLITTVESLIQTKRGKKVGKFDEVTLSHTTGITRDKCDHLKSMGMNLNIYM